VAEEKFHNEGGTDLQQLEGGPVVHHLGVRINDAIGLLVRPYHLDSMLRPQLLQACITSGLSLTITSSTASLNLYTPLSCLTYRLVRYP
jgi:hypothetical protein